MIQLALTELRRGRAEEALPVAAEAARLAPRVPAARLVHGRALLAAGQTEAGVREMEEAVRLAPETPKLHLSLAAAYAEAGRAATPPASGRSSRSSRSRPGPRPPPNLLRSGAAPRLEIDPKEDIHEGSTRDGRTPRARTLGQPRTRAGPSATSSKPAVPVFGVESAVVLLDVVVRDKKGRLVRDLEASDFEVLEDGKKQEVVAFEVVDRGVDYLPGA